MAPNQVKLGHLFVPGPFLAVVQGTCHAQELPVGKKKEDMFDMLERSKPIFFVAGADLCIGIPVHW